MTMPVARMTDGQGADLCAAGDPEAVPVLGDLDDPGGDEVNYQNQRPGIERNEQQFGQPNVQKFLHVGEPFLVKVTKERRRRLALV